MPPHCDTRDGPVVKAAIKALDTENVNLILIWVQKAAEKELKESFDKTLQARKCGKQAKQVADDWFFETAIRLHRAGEGAPYTGLKPAGLDEGPVVPRAEKAIESGDPKEAIGFVLRTIEEELQRRFNQVNAKKKYDENDVVAGREYVHAFINFVVYSHHLYAMVKGDGTNDEEKGGHGH
ncbi:hypothetical protein DSECCO2_396750 [anaerobic digester metagenome]